MDYIKLAQAVGFPHAAIMPVSELVIVPEYRKYCEMNVCGNYDKVPTCPSKCGTVEYMVSRMKPYKNALIIQSIHEVNDIMDHKEMNRLEIKHNKLAEVLTGLMEKDGIQDYLVMSAGPWKKNSCLSAYCIDAQKMADYCGIECWVDDGRARFFTLILY